MPDIMSPEKRRKLMAQIKGKNTGPERYLLALLHSSGMDFGQHDRGVSGCPDFVFYADRVAVFVDGDFWHGWRLSAWKSKLSPFWAAKLEANRKRDVRISRRLRALGWRVIRIWEHQIERDVGACILRIAKEVHSQHLHWTAVEKRLREMPVLKRRNHLPKVKAITKCKE